MWQKWRQEAWLGNKCTCKRVLVPVAGAAEWSSRCTSSLHWAARVGDVPVVAAGRCYSCQKMWFSESFWARHLGEVTLLRKVVLLTGLKQIRKSSCALSLEEWRWQCFLVGAWQPLLGMAASDRHSCLQNPWPALKTASVTGKLVRQWQAQYLQMGKI